MLSRAEEWEQIYMEMPKKRNKEEKIDLVIKANPYSMEENKNLVRRSIVENIKSNHYRSSSVK